MTAHVSVRRRRREGLTDFRARKKAIASGSVLLVVRVSNKNVSSQFVKPEAGGDKVLSAAHSRQLLKMGWSGSPKSTPACYLLGLLAGRKGLARGVKEAILYNGVIPFIKGSRIAAFAKGVLDSGVKMSMDEEALPSEDRVTGKTIAEFASKLAREDKETYSKRFSSLAKGGFKPEDYPAQFAKVKAAVAGGAKK